MKLLLIAALTISSALAVAAQTAAQRVFDAERSLQKVLSEKGRSAAIATLATPDAICYDSGAPVSCAQDAADAVAGVEFFPTLIDVSTNEAMAYATGSAVVRRNGAETFGEFVRIWMRRPDGSYKFAVDALFRRVDKGNAADWTSPADIGKEANSARSSAADSANAFFELLATRGSSEAYKKFLASDARVMTDGTNPVVGRDAAIREAKREKSTYVFNSRSVFTQAADIAYVTNKYQIGDKNARQTANGNLIQIWKLRDRRWQLVLDFRFVKPLP